MSLLEVLSVKFCILYFIILNKELTLPLDFENCDNCVVGLCNCNNWTMKIVTIVWKGFAIVTIGL